MTAFSVNQTSVAIMLSQVQAGHIAIPELQRPFVWSTVKVRDLIDSLYKGYPVGYLITWQSTGADVKGGGKAAHRQILIDGQQRITSLRAALLGLSVTNDKYQQVKISIAFNPTTEVFATTTPFIRRDNNWIADISEVFTNTNTFGFVSDFLEKSPHADRDLVARNIGRLAEIKNSQIGVISLKDDLDVETVAEIFIRINSKGVALSSADFAMSKIATYGERGRNLRKLIDYFCHLSVSPHVLEDIEANDREFAETAYLSKIKWLKDTSEDLYDPKYGDIIRVAGLVGFNRGKASSIVAELSGRDPETRSIDEARIPLAFDKLEKALLKIVNKYEFENFLMIIKSAGFITPRLISSKNVLNFSYALYLLLREDGSLAEGARKHFVRRWFVMSILTGRSSGSFESNWDQDLRRIAEIGIAEHLRHIEASELSDVFWDITLPANLETTGASSPYYNAFLASQVAGDTKGFLSRSITVGSMFEHSGDIHHLVPKNYLTNKGIKDRRDYNQVANQTLTETAVNLAIRDQAPKEYMARVESQIESGKLDIGEIRDLTELERNLAEHAIPSDFKLVDHNNYFEFLAERRLMMSHCVRDYYRGL